MKDLFMIPIMDIDPDWSLRGFNHNYYAVEYCQKVLKIPSKYIAQCSLSIDGLEIHLTDIDSVKDEVWYTQLIRLRKSYKISQVL